MNVQADTDIVSIIDNENLPLLNSDNGSQVTIRSRCMYFI
jgi:hypothetical protein